MAFSWTDGAVKWLVAQVKANRQKLDRLQISKDITLHPDAWTDGQQTVNVDGVTASNMVIVTVSRWWVQCISQGAGTLTFAYTVRPPVAVTAHISIHNDL